MDEAMDAPFNPRELLRIVLLRKWAFLVPAGLALVAAIAVNFLLPTLYRSQATILIESQDVPENVVPSLVTEQIDRRLQIISRQVLSSGNLLRIADEHGLYADERDVLSRGAIAGRMRARLETDTVVTPFNDSRTGRSGQMTLAFQIAFSDPDPAMARDITNALASAYLASDLKTRRSVAARTTDFLATEREALDQRIAGIEDELAEFKTTHRELLPAEASFKRQMVNNLEERLRRLDTDLRVLREREGYLATQLAMTNEFAAGRNQGDTPESRLELIRAELAVAQARYESTHPDVIRLRREVQSLEGVVGARTGTSALAERESMLRSELATLQDRYTEQHPDVARVRRELEAVSREIDARGDGGAASVDRNPAFVQLSAQLNSVRAEMDAIEAQSEDLRAERATLQQQLARAPEVEREYTRITRRLDNAVADRQQLADKEASARLSGSLETNPGGGQLTLLEPPNTPNSPSSPRTKLILALGLVLGVGGGGVTLVLSELLDRSIRSVGDLARIVGDTPLAAIPPIVTAADRRRLWLRRFAGAAVILAVVGGGLTWAHYQVTPLDVLSYQATNQAEDWFARTFPNVSGEPTAPSGAE
jgi:uncharacterized protein involved in exopolysaccharide biosynthesis